MARTKTATLEQHSQWGTGRAMLALRYRGHVVSWYQGASHVYAIAPHHGRESVEAFKAHAKAQGFTHLRIIGEWSGEKPRGGKL